MRRTDQWLLGCFAVTMAVYTAAFTAAFSDLPLNIPPWHQLLLLYFHAFPMFFLQLLLCRRARAVWRLLVPLALLAVPGVLFLSAAGWMVMGWSCSCGGVPRRCWGAHWRGWCGQSLCEGRAGGWENRPEGAIIGSSEEK